jgi:adenylate kinase family enzyme
MIKICDYPCKNRRQAEQEEDKHMMELKANLNMKRASRTQQEYRDDNKEKIKEYMKEYYETKKSTISEKQKEKSLVIVAVK